MQSDLGKLFVGGISWDTDEERLREYFSAYGEVLEAVIMKDRATGRARGFGFVVFADHAVAERVVKEKHNIDGRAVEAKKAVPRDDQSTMSRSTSSIQGSPGPGRSKKIFVGGLASTVTESDFKNYFEQFGTITDVVVMYDHNTQRPRGFGFITYDTEDAVDKVLLKTFHELNGKMVEVKRAVPKELSPNPSQSPLGRYNYGLSRMNNLLDGGYGARIDSRFSPIAGGRSLFAPFGSSYGLGLNFEPGLSPGYGGSANVNSSLSYGQGLNPYYSSNRFGNSISFDRGNGVNASSLNSPARNLWGDGGLRYGTNPTSSSNFVGGNIGGGNFSNSGVWGSSSIPSRDGGNVSGRSGNLGYGNGDNIYGLAGGHGRNVMKSGTAPIPPYAASIGSYDTGALADFYGGGLGYDDRTWGSSNSEQDATGSLGYGLGNGPSDMSPQSSTGYVGSYGVGKRQPDRGIGG